MKYINTSLSICCKYIYIYIIIFHIDSNLTEAAKDAKAKANQANNDLYLLNTGFKNVTDTLQEKTVTVTGAKDMAMDLQKRANALSNSATNKIANLKGNSIYLSSNIQYHSYMR